MPTDLSAPPHLLPPPHPPHPVYIYSSYFTEQLFLQDRTSGAGALRDSETADSKVLRALVCSRTFSLPFLRWSPVHFKLLLFPFVTEDCSQLHSSNGNVQKAGHGTGPEKLPVNCPSVGNTSSMDRNPSVEGHSLNMHVLLN